MSEMGMMSERDWRQIFVTSERGMMSEKDDTREEG
jgi:hypothetical protein